MNKFFKSLLALLVLLTFSSCVMEVANTNTITKTNEKESFEFNFRTIQGLEGKKLIVTLSSGDVTIETKSQEIKTANENIKFEFNNLLIGDTVTVKAEIVDNHNTVIYSGNDSIIIKPGKNEINLNLEAAQVSLTLSPNLNLNDGELNGAHFIVSVNGNTPISVPIDPSTPTVKANIGFVKIGSILTIESKIVKNISGREIILYSNTQTTEPIKQGGNISLDLSRNSVRLILEAKLPTKAGVDSPMGEHPFIIFNIVQSDGTTRSLDYEFNAEEDSASVDFGYFNKGTVIKNIYTSVKESKNSQKEILSSNSIINHTITVNDNQNIHKVNLDLKLPLTVSTDLDPSLTYLSGATYTIFVNGNKTITEKLNEIKRLSHKLVVNKGDLITVEISKEIDGINETLFTSKTPINATLGITEETTELQAVTKELTISTTIPLKDLNDTNSNPLIIVNKDSGLPIEKEFNIRGVDTTVNVTTDVFDANVGETLDISIVNIEVTEPSSEQKRVIMYQGNYTVKSNSPSQVTLNLTQVRTKLKVTPPAALNPTSLERYRGSIFEVSLNGQKKQVLVGEIGSPEIPSPSPINDMTLDLGYAEINKPVSINARIYNATNNDEFYTYDGQITPKASDDKIELNDMVINNGLFMWGRETSKDRPIRVARVYTEKDHYDDIFQSDSPIGTQKLLDYIYDKNGDLWVLLKGSQSYQLGVILHGSNPKTLSIGLAEINSLPTTFEPSCIAPYNNGFIIAGLNITDTVSGKEVTNKAYNLTYDILKKQTPTASEYSLSLPIEMQINHMINSVYIDGNSIYASFDGQTGLKIYKGTINENNITLNKPLFDGATSLDAGFNFYVTDLQVVDNILYALIIDNTINDGGSSTTNSRGALLKIEENKTPSIIGLHKNALENPNRPDIPPEEKDYVLEYEKEEPGIEASKYNAENFFVGPRKFIAIKPKKLVIADAGAMLVTDPAGQESKSKLKKRITTINLDTLTMTHQQLNDLAFEGKLTGSYNEYAAEIE